MPHCGFVAMLDVLGFSALVSGDDDRLNSYVSCLQEVIGDPDASKVEYVVFSDSIVLTTGKDVDSFQSLIQRCSHVLGLMLDKEIALRGAVAYGDYIREKNSGGVFVAGKAIIDAYNFEQQQDWVGIMLAPSAIRQKPDLTQLCVIGTAHNETEIAQLQQRLKWCSFVQPCHMIAFHSDNPIESNYFDGFAIVPTTGTMNPRTLTNDLDRCMSRLKWLKSLAPNPSAQKKYQQADQWLYPICGQWRDIAVRFEQAGIKCAELAWGQ
jgi:hypothetical protein